MPSFDEVSKVDMQEVQNALQQTRKEIQQRLPEAIFAGIKRYFAANPPLARETLVQNSK